MKRRMARERCEHQPRIDMVELRAAGFLRLHDAIRVTCSGERGACSFGITRLADASAEVRATSSNRGVENLLQVKLTFSTLPGGRQRVWWSCPSCERRCRVLYGWPHLQCRLCADLRYASQLETGPWRPLARRNKLRSRLSRAPNAYDFPRRPKGMHRATYARHLRRDVELTTLCFARVREDIAETLNRRRIRSRVEENTHQKALQDQSNGKRSRTA